MGHKAYQGFGDPASRMIHAREAIKAEIAEMVKDGNDPDLTDLVIRCIDYSLDHYNAGRIAGLRLALDILEGR